MPEELVWKKDEHWKTCNCDRCPSKDYIYVLKCQDFYKIGQSKDVPTRLDQISPLVPFEVQLVAYWPCAAIEARQLEKLFHEGLAKYRVKGEWFCLSQRDIDGMAWVMGQLTTQEFCALHPTDHSPDDFLLTAVTKEDQL